MAASRLLEGVRAQVRTGHARAAFGILRRPSLRRAVYETWRDRRRGARSPHAAARPRILAYHAIGVPLWNVNSVSRRRFARHLTLARDLGYRIEALAKVVEAPATEPLLAITFDDGLRCLWDEARPLLAEHGVPWTVFTTTDAADRRTGKHPEMFLGWDELRELVGEGVHVGSHSTSHPDFGPLGYDAALAELAPTRTRFREELGVDATDFAIPFGNSRNWNPDAQRAAEDAGFTRIYAQSEDLRPAGTIGRSFVSCFDDDATFTAMLAGAFDGWEEPPVE